MNKQNNATACKKSHCLLTILIMISFFLPGCLAKSPTVDMQPQYYPRCYQPFADLEQSRQNLISRTLIGAGIGAVGGAVVGTLATGDVKGLFVGTVVGLFAGGAAGYTYGKLEQIDEDKKRLRSYQATMNIDMHNASRVEQYAMASMQCYTREFDKLLTQYKNNLISREDAEARYQEIRQGLVMISEILDDSKQELTKRDMEYRNSLESEAELKNQKSPEIATLETRRARAVSNPEPQAVAEEKSPRIRNRNKNKQNQENKIQRTKKEKTQQSSIVNPELAVVTAELQAREQRAKENAKKIEKDEIKQVKEIQKNKSATVNELSSYYEDKYLGSVVSLEEAEKINQKTLTAISIAAQHAGIDMV